MEDYSEIKYDKSCSFLYWFFHQEQCYRFPVIYDDGSVSRLKSSLEGKRPCGILCKGYIVSIWRAPEKMTKQEAKEYCAAESIAWRPSCVPPRKVMRFLLKNVAAVNEIIRDLGGDLIDSRWYMVANDKFGYPLDDIMLGISLQHLDDYAGRGGIICWEIKGDTKASFYPAARMEFVFVKEGR